MPTAPLSRLQGTGNAVIDEHPRSIDFLPGFHGAAGPRASSEDQASAGKFCLQCGRTYAAPRVICPRDGQLLDDAHLSFLWLG